MTGDMLELLGQVLLDPGRSGPAMEFPLSAPIYWRGDDARTIGWASNFRVEGTRVLADLAIRPDPAGPFDFLLTYRVIKWFRRKPVLVLVESIAALPKAEASHG